MNTGITGFTCLPDKFLNYANVTFPSWGSPVRSRFSAPMFTVLSPDIKNLNKILRAIFPTCKLISHCTFKQRDPTPFFRICYSGVMFHFDKPNLSFYLTKVPYPPSPADPSYEISPVSLEIYEGQRWIQSFLCVQCIKKTAIIILRNMLVHHRE